MDILWLFGLMCGWTFKILGAIPIPGFSLFKVFGEGLLKISEWASGTKVSPQIRIISDVVAFILLLGFAILIRFA